MSYMSQKGARLDMSMSKRKRRKHNITLHATRRALERFDNMSRFDLEEIVKMIQRNDDDVKFLYRTTNRVSVFMVYYKGNNMNVVYDRKRKIVATVY